MVSKNNFNTTILRTLAVIIFCGVFFGIVRSYFGDYIYHSYPKNTFLFDPADRFNDLYNTILVCSNNNPYFNSDPFPSNYFPVANTILYVFSLLKNKALIAICFLGLFLITYAAFIYKWVTPYIKRYFLEIVIIFSFSYPIFFNVDRLNLELYNFLLCGFWLYFKDKNKTLLALLCLSISISLKLYTGVFVILYLKEKKYKEIALTGIITGLLSVISLLTFKGGAINNFNQMLLCMKGFTATYTTSITGLHHNLSLFGIIKIAGTAALKIVSGNRGVSPDVVNKILPYYSLMCFLLFAFIVYVILKRDLPKWMILFLLTSVLILLPHVSYDYKLIFIYLPLLYFIQQNEGAPYQKFFTVCFSLLLIPHNYFYLLQDISIGVFIYPLVITSMVFLIILKRVNAST